MGETLRRVVTYEASPDLSDAACDAESKVLHDSIAAALEALVLEGMGRGLRPVGPIRITIEQEVRNG